MFEIEEQNIKIIRNYNPNDKLGVVLLRRKLALASYRTYPYEVFEYNSNTMGIDISLYEYKTMYIQELICGKINLFVKMNNREPSVLYLGSVYIKKLKKICGNECDIQRSSIFNLTVVETKDPNYCEVQ